PGKRAVIVFRPLFLVPFLEEQKRNKKITEGDRKKKICFGVADFPSSAQVERVNGGQRKGYNYLYNQPQILMNE
ncbi:MAG: hypothetical protein C5B52_05625, partial [Bacteroidetes bacterium]